MMAETAEQSPLLAGLDRTIEIIEQQVRAQQEAERAAPGGVSRGGAAAPAPPVVTSPGAPAQGAAPQPVDQAHSLEDLTLFLSRLKQIRDWLQQDNRLLPVVDEFIGQKVTQSEKRTNRLNLALAGVTTIIGAILGWLVALLGDPHTLLQLFTGR
jgi:hypothetical protein